MIVKVVIIVVSVEDVIKTEQLKTKVNIYGFKKR
jgi:hypothetical protein